MSNSAQIVSLNISKEKGTVKHPVKEVVLDSHGVIGDAHAGPWHRQVSLLSQDEIDAFSTAANRPIKPGEFGENVTVRGLDFKQIGLLDRLRLRAVELEVTQIGKECHGEGCAIYRDVGECIMPRMGIFARVLQGGKLRAADEVFHKPKIVKIRVITLSDRAFAGEYEDRGGPLLKECVEESFEGKRWHTEITTALLPDDTSRLHAEIESFCRDGGDVIFTTGSTGCGPRDIAPEVVTPLCDKLIPGIMEQIRVKYGSTKPGAVLSRGVAGIIGKTLVYTLPGSVKAVNEYTREILKTLEHLFFTVRGIDRHG